MMGVSSFCSVKSCTALGNPVNGAATQPESTVFGSITRFTCDDGYTLSGSERRTCTADEEWDGDNTVCTSKSTLHLLAVFVKCFVT